MFFFNFIISVRGGHYYYLRRELQIARGLIGAGGTVHCPLSFAHYNKRSASWLFLSLQVERRRVVGGWVGGWVGGGVSVGKRQSSLCTSISKPFVHGGRPKIILMPRGTRTYENVYRQQNVDYNPCCVLIIQGSFEMIVGVLTTCHTQYT